MSDAVRARDGQPARVGHVLGVPLGAAHEIGLATALSSSIVLVLLGGELPAFAWLVAFAPWLGAALRTARVRVPGVSGTLLGLGGLALALATLAQGGAETSVLAFTELVFGLVAGRTLVRTTSAHDTQALGLSLLLVLAGSVLNVKITFLPLFVIYAIAAVWALATRQLLAGASLAAGSDEVARARTDVVTPSFFAGTGAVALGVLATAGVLFLAFPRVGLGDVGGFVKKQDKLPTNVGLRGDPRALGGTDVVARISGVSRAEWERALYLRGVVYDVVDLDGFSQTPRELAQRRVRLELADAMPRNARYTVTVAPVVGDRVLTLGSVRSARTLSGGSMNAARIVPIVARTNHDELRTAAALDGALRYEVLGGIAHAADPELAPRDPVGPPADDETQAARYLALPAAFDDTLRTLGATIAGEGAPLERAERLRAFFLREFRYGLDPPRFADLPVRAFLLDSRQGHCEFFAAAFALLLRSQGIPARVVGGYQGGAWDDGTVVFQERHAHAWVEWYLPGAGWVVDDATPVPSAPREMLGTVDTLVERVRRLWDDSVLDFAFEDQMAALTSARRAGLSLRAIGALLAIAVLAAAVAWLWRRVRRGGRARADAAPLATAIAACAGRAAARPVRASETLREAIAAVPAGHPARAPLDAALYDYERLRFGEQDLAPGLVQAHIRALRRAANRRQSAS